MGLFYCSSPFHWGMYCEIIDFDATTCALALDSGHITHVGQLSHSTIPSGKVYGLKRSYARKSIPLSLAGICFHRKMYW